MNAPGKPNAIDLYAALLSRALELVDGDRELADALAQSIFAACKKLPQWPLLTEDSIVRVANAYMQPETSLRFLSELAQSPAAVNSPEAALIAAVDSARATVWIDDAELLPVYESPDNVDEDGHATEPIQVDPEDLEELTARETVEQVVRTVRSPALSILLHVAAVLLLVFLTTPRPAEPEALIVVTLRDAQMSDTEILRAEDTPKPESLEPSPVEKETLLPDVDPVEPDVIDEFASVRPVERDLPEFDKLPQADISNDIPDSLSGELDFAVSDLSVIGLEGGPSADFNGGMFSGRGRARERFAHRYGGSEASLQAVDAALDWLARHQDKSGLWYWNAYSLQCNGKDDHCCVEGAFIGRRGATAVTQYDVAATGLALMAFLAGGHTNTEGDFQRTVDAGLEALMQRQSKGIFSDNMYAQAIATAAMAEAYGMTNDKKIRKSAREGIGAILASQHSDGGFRYEVIPYEPSSEVRRGKLSGISDLSVSGWVAVALKIATETDLMSEAEERGVLKDFEDFVAACEAKSDYRLASYTPKSGGTIRMTAVAMVCNLLLGKTRNLQTAVMQSTSVANGLIFHTKEVVEKMDKVVELMQRYRRAEARALESEKRTNPGRVEDDGIHPRLPVEEDSDLKDLKDRIVEMRADISPAMDAGALPIDLYFTYYGQMGLFMQQAREWKKWNASILRQTLPYQGLDACRRGSWMKDTNYGSSPVYATAITALMLQVYWRYPIIND